MVDMINYDRAKRLDVFRRRHDTQDLPVAAMPVKSYNNSSVIQQNIDQSVAGHFDPSSVLLENAVALPVSAKSASATLGDERILEHCLYDARLNAVTVADHIMYSYRGFQDNLNLPLLYKTGAPDWQRCEGDYYFMGFYMPHFGHFVLETITRFWYALNHELSDNTQFVFHVFDIGSKNIERFKARMFENFHGEYLSALGITPERCVIIDRPMCFERLRVPQCAISLSKADNFYSSEAALVWEHVSSFLAARFFESKGDVSEQRSRKIYLTRRSHYVKERMIENEEAVEDAFRRRGYLVVAPEELGSEAEKHALLSHCDVLAGVPGSGLLNSIFMPPGSKVIALVSEKMNKNNNGLVQQITFDHYRGITDYIFYEQDHSTSGGVQLDVDKLNNFLDTYNEL